MANAAKSPPSARACAPRAADVVWADMRKMYDAMGKQYPTADDVALRAEDAGGVKAEWSSTPAAEQSRAILYLHGGGYRDRLASPATGTWPANSAAPRRPAPWRSTTGWHAVKRPSPPHVDDALSGYRFLLDDVASSRSAHRQIAGGQRRRRPDRGDTCWRPHDQVGLPQPACGFCISPLHGHWRSRAASMKSKADEDPMVSEPSARRMASDSPRRAHPATRPSPSPHPATDLQRPCAPLLECHGIGSAEALHLTIPSAWPA